MNLPRTSSDSTAAAPSNSIEGSGTAVTRALQLAVAFEETLLNQPIDDVSAHKKLSHDPIVGGLA